MKRSRWSIYRGLGDLESGQAMAGLGGPGRMNGRAHTRSLADDPVWFRQADKTLPEREIESCGMQAPESIQRGPDAARCKERGDSKG